MWIIYFNGAPHFWLSGGEVYRIGKKGCDIIIKDDPSISRTHLSFEIGLLPLQRIRRENSSSQPDTVSQENAYRPICGGSFPNFDAQDAMCDAPAAITLVDSSTYGSTVIALGSKTDSAMPRRSLDFASSSRAQAIGVVGLPHQNYVDTGVPERASSPAAYSKPNLGILDDATVVVREQHHLVKGTPFHVPLDHPSWREFAVVLGNHGATLVFAWADLYALVENVVGDQYAKLEHELNRCGVQFLASSSSPGFYANALVKADFLVSSSLEPTPWTLAMLCRMKPIVLPSFFTAILSRATPQAPLPDPCDYLPPVSHVWKRFVSSLTTFEFSSKNNSSSPISSDFRKPNARRRGLFAGLTFVVLRQTLLVELAPFVECASGCVVLDDTLKVTANSTIAHADLESFARCHKQHVVVLKKIEKSVLEESVAALSGQNLLSYVDYDELVRCVVLAEPLSLTVRQDPSTGLSTCKKQVEKVDCTTREDVLSSRSSANLRKTEATPVFPSLNSLERRVDAAQEQISSSTAPTTERFVDTHGWISRRSTDNSTTDHSEALYNSGQNLDVSSVVGHTALRRRARDEMGEFAGSYKHTDKSDWDKLELPPYPCFQAYHGENTSAPAVPLLRFAGKQFCKQHVETASSSPVELDVTFLASSGAGVISSRELDLATSDIIPDRRAVTRNLASGSSSGKHSLLFPSTEGFPVAGVADVVEIFNAFDTAAHNSINRKKGTVAKKRTQMEGPRNGARSTSRTVILTGTGVNCKPFSSPLSASYAACDRVDILEMVRGDDHTSETQNSIREISPVDPTHDDFNVFDIDGIF